ncbi:MAG: pyridoxamine 5'-phosphate oxidase [Bacteroidota bacterium]
MPENTIKFYKRSFFGLYKKYLFTLTGLNEKNIHSDPIKQFGIWFEDAAKAGIPLSEAMILSTVSQSGKPSARAMLLKGFDENGFVFYTNYESRKAKEISQNPYAAITFLWTDLNRQVRIEGKIEKISVEQSDEYCKSRPRGSQIGAWASPQSDVIPDRKSIVMREKYFTDKFKNLPIPCPPYWGGYCLIPYKIEFWQARVNRLHDRIRFSLQEDNSWKMERLAP